MIYLNLVGSILIGTSLLVSQPAEKENSIEPNDSSWEKVDQDENVSIYQRWINLPNGRQTRERKGIFYVDRDLEEIVPFVNSAGGIKNWMRNVEESKEINYKNDSGKMVYLFFDTPWPFKNRDLVTSITTIKNCDNSSVEILFSANSEILPEKKNVIRLQSYEAWWKISKSENGQTQVVFSAFSDTPPVAPRWVQDPVTARLFKDNLVNLKELLTLNNQ